MVLVVLCVPNAMIHKTCLPYFKGEMKFPFGAKGEAALDELQSPFQRYFRCRGQKQMKVIRHHHKLMRQKATLSPTPQEHPSKGQPCDRTGEARDAPRSLRYASIGLLGAFHQ